MNNRFHWEETKDYALVARLCESWNSGRLYEIFWEYADLSPRTLKEKKATSSSILITSSSILDRETLSQGERRLAAIMYADIEGTAL